MGGYRLRRGPSQGVHDELNASCAVLVDDATRVVLFSLDLLCLDGTQSERIKFAVSNSSGIPPSHIVLTCTHTHSGPDILHTPGAGSKIKDYQDWLPGRLSELVEEAVAQLHDVNMRLVKTEIRDIAFNRRLELTDGSHVINIQNVDATMVRDWGPVDPCVSMILFEENGIVSGALVNFTLHPTVLGEDNYLFSRDYPGFLVDNLEEDLPGSPVVLFFNGAFGNINQIQTPGIWIATYEEAQRIGESIAHELLGSMELGSDVIPPDMKLSHTRISIPHRLVKTRLPDQSGSLPMKTETPQSVKQPFITPEKERIFADEARKYLRGDDEMVDLQVIHLGDVEIITVPGELFVEYGLEIIRRSRLPTSMIFGNANGYIGYVPTRTAFREGGYETLLSLTSRLVPEAGEIIIEQIEKMRWML